MMKKITVLVAVLLFVGCSNSRRDSMIAEVSRLLRAVHISEGDAPVVQVLSIDENRTACLERLGNTTLCSRLDSGRFSHIRREISNADLSQIPLSPQLASHLEEIHLMVGESEAQMLLDEVPQRLIPLLKLLDEIFQEEFGNRYDDLFYEQSQPQG